MSLSLLEFCEATGVTIAAVARQVGVNDKWLYKVAKGERGVSLEVAARIERATFGKVTPSDLTKTRIAWIEANPDRPDRRKPAPAKKNSRASAEAA